MCYVANIIQRSTEYFMNNANKSEKYWQKSWFIKCRVELLIYLTWHPLTRSNHAEAAVSDIIWSPKAGKRHSSIKDCEGDNWNEGRGRLSQTIVSVLVLFCIVFFTAAVLCFVISLQWFLGLCFIDLLGFSWSDLIFLISLWVGSSLVICFILKVYFLLCVFWSFSNVGILFSYCLYLCLVYSGLSWLISVPLCYIYIWIEKIVLSLNTVYVILVL